MREASRPDVSCLRRIVIELGERAKPQSRSCASRTSPPGSARSSIRAKIRAETGLTASAGVSYYKFLAKLASDHGKPDGLFVITPKMGPAFVEGLPVEKFHGVGPATAAKMHRLGIKTGFDLREQTLAFLQQHFGIMQNNGFLSWRRLGKRVAG